MSRILYIVDIKRKQKNHFNIKKLIEESAEILSLTAYSSYLLDRRNITYNTFHTLENIDDFNNNVLDAYVDIENIFIKYIKFGYLFKDLAYIKTYETYINIIYDFINLKKDKGYKIVYITDTIKQYNLLDFDLTSNDTSGLYYFNNIDEYINVNKIDKYFYKLIKVKSLYFKIINIKVIFSKIINKMLSKNNKNLQYDNSNYSTFWNNQESINVREININQELKLCIENISNIVLSSNKNKFINTLYTNVLNNFKNSFKKNIDTNKIIINPFVYLTDNSYSRALLYEKNNLSKIFMQHGCYIYDHIFLKYNEIVPADVNLVFNQYTKDLFDKNNATNCYNIGSINFSKEIKTKKVIYDFLYITHCTTYSWNGVYIDGNDSKYAMDGMNIYNRHKSIIQLFGTKFKDRKICIKIQPGIFLGSTLYVPFLELSEKYKNIAIEFNVPISTLIENTKYIISDYFSSEFINRELHYKRDIILFKNAPLTLPEETLDDMDKMFILVDTIDDLEDKIVNIESITKDRKRYDDIIEYYSSKKCDTKKIVTEILEKELNGR